MTDDQVERLIWKEIKRKDITIHDMIGMPNHGVDPHPLLGEGDPHSSRAQDAEFGLIFVRF